LWEFEVFPPNGSRWDSLELGLASLLKILIPHKQTLQEYPHGHEVFIWCGHFTSSFDGGPFFSAQMLKTLGDFGVSLWLDTYSGEA
jgi:hypothetical protein